MLSKYITVTIRKAISLLATGVGISQNLSARRVVTSSVKPVNKRFGCPPPLYIH